jgi:hypothetical protein
LEALKILGWLKVEVETVSKLEFAMMIGVSAARVSQYISEGKIGPEELVGSGQRARIKVAQAKEKLNLRLDPGQRNGNGINTKLNVTAPSSDTDQLDQRIKLAKAETAEATNRRAAEDEKARRGIYVLAEHASAEGSKLAANIVQQFESAMIDFAAEIAATYKLPQRDLMHLAQKRGRDARLKISANLVNEAADLPATIEEETV